jgi:hypothetical protein
LSTSRNALATKAIHVSVASENIGGNGCKAPFDEWNSLVVEDKSRKNVKKSGFGKQHLRGIR